MIVIKERNFKSNMDPQMLITDPKLKPLKAMIHIVFRILVCYLINCKKGL
jgi:hypothetical protein